MRHASYLAAALVLAHPSPAEAQYGAQQASCQTTMASIRDAQRQTFYRPDRNSAGTLTVRGRQVQVTFEGGIGRIRQLGNILRNPGLSSAECAANVTELYETEKAVNASLRRQMMAVTGLPVGQRAAGMQALRYQHQQLSTAVREAPYIRPAP